MIHIQKGKLLSRGGNRRTIMGLLSLLALILAIFSHGLSSTYPASAPTNASPSSQEWSSYLFDKSRAGYNHFETAITASTAADLKLYWSYTAGGSISSQPVTSNGNIYWGSWDGYEHATSLSGSKVWDTNLGQTTDSECNVQIVGVAGAATIATFVIGGVSTPVVFVGGGNAQFYALNARTGAVIWHTPLGSTPSNFIWDSPVVYNGSVYIGVSSLGDCPLTPGKLFQLDAKTGSIQHTFNVVPTGCTGGGIWGSPTIDSSANTVYFTTGNASSCSSREPYGEAIVELHASDLSVVGSWQVPADQATVDGDFGSTPTLFSANGKDMVGAANKNGIYYAFKRDALGSGPVWKKQIADEGDCPQCGSGSISPSAWDGSHLFVAGGNTTINGTSYKGSLRKLDPATGNFTWQLGLSAPVLAAVTVVPTVAVVTAGTNVVVVSTSSGQVLKTFTDGSDGSLYYGAASISDGVISVGNMDGRLYAYGL